MKIERFFFVNWWQLKICSWIGENWKKLFVNSWKLKKSFVNSRKLKNMVREFVNRSPLERPHLRSRQALKTIRTYIIFSIFSKLVQRWQFFSLFWVLRIRIKIREFPPHTHRCRFKLNKTFKMDVNWNIDISWWRQVCIDIRNMKIRKTSFPMPFSSCYQKFHSCTRHLKLFFKRDKNIFKMVARGGSKCQKGSKTQRNRRVYTCRESKSFLQENLKNQTEVAFSTICWRNVISVGNHVLFQVASIISVVESVFLKGFIVLTIFYVFPVAFWIESPTIGVLLK